jgi:hypothetical protein
MVIGEPTDRARLAYGLCALVLERYAEAAPAVRETLIRRPDLATGTFDLRRSFSRRDDLTACAEALRRRCDAHADDAEARMLLGFVEFFGGDAALGRRAFEDYARMRPDDDALRPFLDALRRVSPPPGGSPTNG